jgi:hypothetical protein
MLDEVARRRRSTEEVVLRLDEDASAPRVACLAASALASMACWCSAWSVTAGCCSWRRAEVGGGAGNYVLRFWKFCILAQLCFIIRNYSM